MNFFMNRLNLLLLILLSCTVMFTGLLILACLYWVENRHGMAIVCFALTFISVLGQITALASSLRERNQQQRSRILFQLDAQINQSIQKNDT